MAAAGEGVGDVAVVSWLGWSACEGLIPVWLDGGGERFELSSG
jgi:hypothetical protein